MRHKESCKPSVITFHLFSRHALAPVMAIVALCAFLPLGAGAQSFRHVDSPAVTKVKEERRRASIDSAIRSIPSWILPDSMSPRSAEQILAALPPLPESRRRQVNRVFAPWIFSGYRPLTIKSHRLPAPGMNLLGREAIVCGDTPGEDPGNAFIIPDVIGIENESDTVSEMILVPEPDPEMELTVLGDVTPQWLRDQMTYDRIQNDFMQVMMTERPWLIYKAEWDLPVPPKLPEDDASFAAFMRKLDLPQPEAGKTVFSPVEIEKRHWLHTVNGALQFSQAYISPNWYQGGNNNLAVLFNFLWDVSLNQVYHPKYMLQSTLSYKLGLNSTPKNSVHPYLISDDIFQWNFKAGLKAFTSWFYSFTTVFKTQFLHNYKNDTEDRTASFLSPGELNLGLGMTYSRQNQRKTFKLSLSISPLSYNLKTCVDPRVDHAQYNIKPDRKSVSEIGSSLEANTEWAIHDNITWRSRVFFFTNYDNIITDWENTFNFAINRFLSTQFYFHLRYDKDAVSPVRTGWGRWQMKEILSFGLSYTFSTKP